MLRPFCFFVPRMAGCSAELLCESDEEPLRSANVTEPISVFVLDHFTYELRTAIAKPFERIVDIIEDRRDNGEACTGLVLDPKLVPLAGRPTKPFQGWRYLRPEEAPQDLAVVPRAKGEDALPPALRRELRVLCLL